ncbi:MAG: hypothetical protein QUU85_10365, partial [Candidatus Eisenbacteria bacterium]|nr:hypothetical protein [Candidatus Eisenbacteria bacterium]
LSVALTGAALCQGDAAADAPAGAEEVPRPDFSLPAAQDTTILNQVVLSFREHFRYDQHPDSTLYGTVEQFRALYPDSFWTEKLEKMTNEDGTLAWSLSRDMMGLATMFDATGDAWYLDWLGRLSKKALAIRDDRTGKTDDAGRSAPAWGSPRYAEGVRRVYLVHSALIVQPILEWAKRAPRSPGFGDAEEQERRKAIADCEETLLWHDYQLEPKPYDGEAVYLSGREEPERRFSWQPFNRQNQMARDFYLLWELTGKEDYRARAEKLYRFFRTRIERTRSDAYIWEYEPIPRAPRVDVSVCEDVSHASFTVEATLPACREGFVFEPGDLARFARTFTRYVYLGDGVFQSGIGCTALFTPRYMDRLYAWLPLSQADPQVYWLLRRFLMGNVAAPAPQAIANLVAYKPKGLSGIDTRAQ